MSAYALRFHAMDRSEVFSLLNVNVPPGYKLLPIEPTPLMLAVAPTPKEPL